MRFCLDIFQDMYYILKDIQTKPCVYILFMNSFLRLTYFLQEKQRILEEKMTEETRKKDEERKRRKKKGIINEQ